METTQSIELTNISKSKKIEAYFLIGLILISSLLFLSEGLDLKLAKIFYYPELENPWPEQNWWLWKFFYHAAPIISALICLPSICVYIGSYLKKSLIPYRRHALYVFLAFALGPGVLVNMIFKPYWGRPRPRQVQELGGQQNMHAFWKPGKSGEGYSFPCGHSSVAFSMASLYFLLKRRKPKAAKTIFVASAALGITMGVGRMADGAHFFSDVLWSAIMAYIPCYFLYYKINLDKDQERMDQLSKRKALIQGLMLFSALILSVLVATPYSDKINVPMESSFYRLYVEQGSVEVITPSPETEIAEDQESVVTGNVRGFGFPGSELIATATDMEELKIIKTGFFSDLEANLQLIHYKKNKTIHIILGPNATLNTTNLPDSITWERRD